MPTEITPELVELIRKTVREELQRNASRETHHGLPFSEMQAVVDRMEAIRKHTVLPHEEVEALFEEHRREFGRG